MNKRLTAVAVAGTIGLGAVGAVTLAYPALANGSTPSPSSSSAPAAPNPQQFQDRRVSALKEQLKSLVDDGTLTQAQADKVAAKLAAAGPGFGFGRHGFRGPGGELGGPFGVGMMQLEEAAAKALGISADELRTQLRSGSTIADIAKKQNKDVDAVTSAIVQSARQQLAQAVKDNKLTQAQADAIGSKLADGVKNFVQNGRMHMHLRGGKDGGPQRAPAPGDLPAPPSMPAPGQSTSPSSPSAPSSSSSSESSSFLPLA